jgi:hypothetical protein
MFLIGLIFVLITLLQFSLATYAWLVRKQLPERFSHILGELTEPANVLENYMKIYRKLSLRVNAQINEPVLAEREFLLVNRESMYNPDLFTNFYTIFQLELTKSANTFARSRIFIFQNLLFFTQIVVFIFSIIYQSEVLMAVAIGAALFSFLLAILGFIIYGQILDSTFEISLDLLNLDDVEQARAEALKNDLRYRVFEYPFDIIWKIVQFFKP